jgi:hypothetical protein
MPVNLLLYLAASAFVVLGVAHSYLGERLVLAPLFRLPELPKLLGSSQYMRQILRLAWHVTSLAWVGLASIVVMLAHPPLSPGAVAVAVGVTAFASFLSVLVFTRGKHVAAWVLFLTISIISLYYGAGT